MNSIKRIYLACRTAVAETGIIIFLLPIGITVLITGILFLVDNDSNQMNGQLMQEFSFWDPTTIFNLIGNAGWISGLIVCGSIHNRWFKEENQAVRTLSLPLSNGERFTAMLLLYLGFVPLVCFGIPLLLTFMVYPFAPDFIFLPAPLYLWKSLAIGFIVHTVTCIIWLQPTFAFGKKVIFALAIMIGLAIFYLINTHANVSDTLDVPYEVTTILDDQVVGLNRYAPKMTEAKGKVIKIDYVSENPGYYMIQSVFLLFMLVAGGLALTKKTT